MLPVLLPWLLSGSLAASAPNFAQPVERRVRVIEDLDEESLSELCHQGVRIELRTHSNMLATGVVEVLRHCGAPWVLMRPPFLPAHRERLERLPAAEILLELTQGATLDWGELSQLGPRRLHVRVGGELSSAQVVGLSRLRNVEIELDVRGRVPKADELSRWRSLAHADRVIRLGADVPPELIQTLSLLHPLEIVVETKDNRLPAALLAALVEADLPTRVSFLWPVVPSELVPLAQLRRLKLEVDMGLAPELPRSFSRTFATIGPDVSMPAVQLPDGGFDEQLPQLPQPPPTSSTAPSKADAGRK
jgi:hypothetical protein